MQKKKENNLLDKFVKKNYKNELEKVLEDKFFDESAKGLLLEILYKIETGYKDYATVKKDAQTKEEYIEKFIHIIKHDCKTIKIVKPTSEQSKLLNGRTFIVKKEKSEIIVLPMARKLLYSIAKISKKDKIVKEKYFLVDTTLSNLVNVGNNINMVEPIRDFNGWSWTTVPKEIESIEYNLIYQMLMILIGSKFLELWVKNKEYVIDYLEEFENRLENIYGKANTTKFIESLKKLSIIMEQKVNPQIKEEINQIKNEVEQKVIKFEDKTSFIEELTHQKNKLKEQIKNIDTTINNKELLQQEYMRRNESLPLEQKIFSMRILTEIMVKERENLIEQLEKCNELLKPQNFLKEKEILENKLQTLNMAIIEDIPKELEKELNKIQEIFLNCLKEKVKKAETKQDILKLIYQFRYYNLLPQNENIKTYENKELKNKLKEFGKNLIQKAIELKVMQELAKDADLNYEITKNIFQTRIILLEELCIKLTKEKDEYFIQLFDENIFEEKIKLEINQNINKKDLHIRPNKKIKLFE